MIPASSEIFSIKRVSHLMKFQGLVIPLVLGLLQKAALWPYGLVALGFLLFFFL